MMPVVYQIDRSRRIVFSTLNGTVTGDEALDHEQHLGNDPDFEPIYNQLCDCRHITQVTATGQVIRFVASKSPFSPKARRAIVADKDLVYGLARMYQLMKQDAQIMVFRDMEAARRWLDLA
jgi:hypothetical protein